MNLHYTAYFLTGLQQVKNWRLDLGLTCDLELGLTGVVHDVGVHNDLLFRFILLEGDMILMRGTSKSSSSCNF